MYIHVNIFKIYIPYVCVFIYIINIHIHIYIYIYIYYANKNNYLNAINCLTALIFLGWIFIFMTKVWVRTRIKQYKFLIIIIK